MGWEAPPPSIGGLGGTTNGDLVSSAGGAASASQSPTNGGDCDDDYGCDSDDGMSCRCGDSLDKGRGKVAPGSQWTTRRAQRHHRMPRLC